MDEFLKLLMGISREVIDATFSLSRVKMDLAHACESQDPERIRLAQITMIRAESVYLAKTAALAEKQLEATMRQLKDQGDLEE